jgi:membrane protease YdiL (CAAX protease family)
MVACMKMINNAAMIKIQGHKEPKRYIFAWVLLGFCIVMIYQVIISIILFAINGSPQRSPNIIKLYNSPKITLRKTYSSKMGPTMDIKTINIGICLAIAINLSVFGLLCGLPLMANKIILFRKVIFGELYNFIKGSRVVSFIIASIVSSLIFALAHNDFKFIIQPNHS